ncbi:sensor histidine kinase [Paraflavitalea pollutisoli]|uniref:sensor histidine kinase n=1 Tax=Paraflavitalea pollutisoli TaxID=3034143 RepID=UPI0023EBE862|nr:histidine kinase dimerization/phosphoacceptor domain -containing protein [Paraflavitalea sp. H1-2-19X]
MYTRVHTVSHNNEVCGNQGTARPHSPILRSWGYAVLLFLLPLYSLCQYYPAPLPVTADKKTGLIRQLRVVPKGPLHIHLLIDLGSLYLNLPVRTSSDLQTAASYANQAYTESALTNDRDLRELSLLLLAQVYFREEKPASMIQLLSLAPDDTAKAKLLLTLSFYHWATDQGDFKDLNEKCIKYAREAETLCKRLGLEELAIMARRNIAFVDFQEQRSNAGHDMLQVVEDYRKLGYKRLHYAYFALAFYSMQAGKSDSAYYYSRAAMQSVHDTRDSSAAGDIYLIKGMIDHRQDRFDDAVNAYLQASNYYRHYPGLYNLSSTILHSSLSVSYSKLGRHREAIQYLENSWQKYPPKTWLDSCMYIHKLGHAYREIKQFGKAEQYFLQYLEILERKKHRVLDGYYTLGQLYLDSHQYDKARKYLYQVFGEGFADSTTIGERQAHYMLYLADSATGHYQSAIKHLLYLNGEAEMKLRAKRDSVVTEMDIAYKAKEKEQEIKIKNQGIAILEQKAIAQEDKLRQSRMIYLIAAGCLGLALITLILGYRLYRQKQRNNQRVQMQNEVLQKVVSEKEWLLKEVHHRVKNNLHTIFCLLESQARNSGLEARTALEKSKSRVYAMSLFHQKVYQSEDIEQVCFSQYIRDFLIFLEDSFDLENRNIRVVHELQKEALPTKVAMPLAVIINEALTNAAKYAFEGREQGTIKLVFNREGDTYHLQIIDNGVGIPADQLAGRRSLGMQLMQGLCRDIGATLVMNVDHGTTIHISFKAQEAWQPAAEPTIA